VQVGRVVTISKASLKPRNPKFNTTPHEFEIYLDRGSTLAAVDDHDPDVAAIPRIMFNVSEATSCAPPPSTGCAMHM
jgi:ssDNA-binding replication factor A large subunit